MAKVMIIGVVSLAVLLMAVTASSFRTTITIAEDAENPREQISQRCQQQIQRAQQLRSCEQYLRQSTRFSEEEEEFDNQGRDWRQEFPRCCEQLEQIQDEQCRCEGIRQVVQQQQQRGELQGRERQEVFRTAQTLPGLCRISPQRCEIPTRSPFF
ncbi:2S seed storage albumin protein-like [Nicotiana tomentosiformis]|uniref:2S seed storage albumin protein-like n=1 Tax=Nicotiana tomentosiformis TaxID=4098 RepID=UPI00051BF816|nr:2S sulfur-rich seed storage protein 2-like [Nicotiana tomentosiformis]